MLNQVTLIGRLVRDPEDKQAGGHDLAQFTLAIDRRHNKDETDFVDCVAWRKLSELVMKYCVKGMMVAVTGSLRIDSYEQDGKKRKSTRVTAEDVRFLSGGKGSAEPVEEEEDVADDVVPF